MRFRHKQQLRVEIAKRLSREMSFTDDADYALLWPSIEKVIAQVGDVGTVTAAMFDQLCDDVARDAYPNRLRRWAFL